MVTAAALFFALYWMFHSSGDEAPWMPAGLAAAVVLLVAVAAREVIVRRALTRYILEQNRPPLRSSDTLKSARTGHRSISAFTSTFRALQKQCADADAATGIPGQHLDAYHSCREYLATVDEALQSNGISGEALIALRNGRERVRAMQRHHLLTWASGSSRALTSEAQRRVLISEKVETAMRALDVIDSALKLYPEEPELLDSANAVREFVASVRVARWIELAERDAFKGKYRRAIERYRDALFYLSREQMDETTRVETAERIGREIDMLRVRLKVGNLSRQTHGSDSGSTNKGKRKSD